MKCRYCAIIVSINDNYCKGCGKNIRLNSQEKAYIRFYFGDPLLVDEYKSLRINDRIGALSKY